MSKETKKGWLVLADGTVLEGKSFGAEGSSIGEVVFTTGMTGYQETLTDPSYLGQIVTQTFPLIGNYGVNKEDVESDRCEVKGYIVREWCEHPSNFRCEGTIDGFLKEHNVVGLYGVDTRHLTKKLREAGVMNGMVTTEEPKELDKLLEPIRAYEIKNAVARVTADRAYTYRAEREQYRIALIDYGYKRNIRRSLLERGCTVEVVPATVTAAGMKALGVDGIMLSNGPGDPAENGEAIGNLREILALGIPTFGICLGHQLTALAMGGKTEKLKYGHRGANQPVIDLDTGRTYVTTQNHGYAVVGGSIAPDVGYVSHVNANDRTCEGVRYQKYPVFTVQFHPEACAGPRDMGHLFGQFTEMMDAYKRGNQECR